MGERSFHIPDRVRRKAMASGESGATWLASLDDLVHDLAIEWDLSIRDTLAGGTESLVLATRTADGDDSALKIAIPGLDPTAGELRTLLAAQGRGYAQVLRHDRDRAAMLLERLGTQLNELGLPLEVQFGAICDTLLVAWRPVPAGAGSFMTGAEKARSLAAFIETAWRDLGEPCSARTIETAFHFAELRRQAFNPETAVLAHGDPHAWNTLLAPRDGPGRCKFVDPDGLFIERAYDLGILMREWGAELLAGDPLALGLRRCRLLARLTGLEPEPIWQWGFIERVSSGLLLLKLGLEEAANEFLTVAAAWALAEES